MTYDEYTVKVRARMKKLVRAENFIKKYRFLIIAVADILFIAFIFTMYFAGSFMKDLSVRDAVYGEDTVTQASAFLSGVRYYYKENGIEKPGLPYGAGSYEITAETINPFGVVRRQSAPLTVYKRQAFINLYSFSVEYGSDPEIKGVVSSADLAKGDVITAADIQYDRFKKTSAASINSVTITNRYGVDVTSSYDLQFGMATATVTPRKITVDTASAEKKYDGYELSCHEYEITQGSLAYDDRIEASFFSYITLPGTASNRAYIKIYNKNGENVTDKYTVSERIGSLTVLPLEIVIKTGSSEKEYDKKTLECREYEITYSELLPNHRIYPVKYTERTDPGVSDNIITFRIRDEKDVLISDLYKIKIDAGKLTVRARKITLKSKSSEYLYDGYTHYAESDVKIVSGALYDFDTLVTVGHPSAVAAGEHVNKFEKDNGELPRNAYDITYEYGTMTIRKRPAVFNVRVYADKDKSRAKYIAKITGETVENDKLYSVLYIPVSVSYDAFEGYIKQKIKITNSITQSNATGSYDMSFEIEYDESELEEFRVSAEEYLKEHGSENGTETGESQGEGTYPDDITYPDDTEPPVPAEEIYGPSGIGSGGVGGGIGNSPSPYSEVPDDTPVLSKESVGTVSSFASGAVYLRLRSFGDYTGSGWAEPALYEKENYASPLFMTYKTLSDNGYAESNELEVVYRANDGLVPVPYYSVTTKHGTTYKMTDVAVPNDADGVSEFYFSQIPMVSTSTLLSLGGNTDDSYRDFVYKYYLSLPESTEAEIKKIILQAGLDETSPTVIQDVANYVKNAAKYSGSFEKIPDDTDRVVYFLTKSKEGICGHFASAATVIYRALGIPARYTVGYYVVTDGKYQPADFYEKDAHAWVEVFVDGVGWIPVEVTASSVSPSGSSSELQPPDTGASIFYNRIYFRMSSVKKNYDGKEAYSDTVKLYTGSNLRDGDVIKARTDSIKYTGILSCSAREFAIYDENGNDVTLLYDVVELGEATIEIKPRTVYLPDIDIYVGQTVSLPEFRDLIDEDVAALIGDNDINFYIRSDLSVTVSDDDGLTITGVSAENDHSFKCEFDLGSEGRENLAYADYNENFGKEVVLVQRINVLPFENVRIKEDGTPEKQKDPDVIRIKGENGGIYTYLAVRSADAVKKFDGEYLFSSEYEILSGALEKGHTLVYEGGAYQLYVGSAANCFSRLSVKDEYGVDVTGEYIIDFYPGTLTVVKGEYKIRDTETKIAVDETAELDKIEWVDNISGVTVLYASTGDKPIVRVEDGVLIGISPGVSHIKAVIRGVDLNGDGSNEYDDSYRELTVNVTPKKQTYHTGLYIACAVTAAAAGAAVIFAALRIAAHKKEQVKRDREEK